MSTWSEELDEDFDFDAFDLDYDVTCARCGCVYLSSDLWCLICGHDKVMETTDD